MIKEKYVIRKKETKFDVVQTKLSSIMRRDIVKTGIRVYDNGFIGVAGAIGRYDEAELEQRAIAALKNQIPYPYEVTKNVKQSHVSKGDSFDEEQLARDFEKLLADLRRDQPEFIFFNGLTLIEYETSLVNDQGVELSHVDRYIDLGLGFKEKSSPNIMDGSVEYEGRFYNHEQILASFNETCNAFKNKIELEKTGKLPIIFQMGPYNSLFMKFWTDLSGESVGTKASLFSEQIGKKVFNDQFTLTATQDPTLNETPFFDAEGIVNPGFGFNLIENGKIIAPYTDKKNAYLYNLPLTGSAMAEYDGVPTMARPPKFKINESGKTVKELLNGQRGILIKIAGGGDFTPRGDYSTPVQLAMLFDGEKVVGRLPEFNMSSNVYKMFGEDFIGVSKDTVSPIDDRRYMVIQMEVRK